MAGRNSSGRKNEYTFETARAAIRMFTLMAFDRPFLMEKNRQPFSSRI
ncbi:MAG TPA: hypothetical protein VGC66_14080 [Pyrinomonadaceae bacterium]|jgi:hypothetical protein